MIDATRPQAQAWLASGRPAMLVQVVSHRGSVPRETGTRMLVAADETAGTIGGGHLELKAIALARRQLADGPAGPTDQHYPLGPALGQCCGGAVTLRTGPLDAAALAAWPRPAPLFHLQLHGAGHVGRAIARLLDDLPCQVHWVDEREDAFPAAPSAPHVARLCTDAAQAEVRLAPPGAFYLVLTHRHDLDLAITDAVLRRGDFGYLGLIGSATKRARFLARLRDRGVPAAALARLVCPIGLPGITGKQPEVIALAVLAQVLQTAAADQPRASSSSAVGSSTRTL